MPQQFATHQPDDDVPMRPNPADDALSSAQARLYWKAYNRMMKIIQKAMALNITMREPAKAIVPQIMSEEQSKSS